MLVFDKSFDLNLIVRFSRFVDVKIVVYNLLDIICKKSHQIFLFNFSLEADPENKDRCYYFDKKFPILFYIIIKTNTEVAPKKSLDSPLVSWRIYIYESWKSGWNVEWENLTTFPANLCQRKLSDIFPIVSSTNKR
jgi:hypothetical protein